MIVLWTALIVFIVLLSFVLTGFILKLMKDGINEDDILYLLISGGLALIISVIVQVLVDRGV